MFKRCFLPLLFAAVMCLGGCKDSKNEPESNFSDEKFSVSETRRVYFSKGNLQYQASTGKWRFAEHQYDWVGNADAGNVYHGGVKCNNDEISDTYSGWIDLFAWGTSGWSESGANNYKPTSNSSDNYDYWIGDSYDNELTGEYANADWGVYNKIGSYPSGTWRTPTMREWAYLLWNRPKAAELKGLATVNGVRGAVILPDNWEQPQGTTFVDGEHGFNFSANVYNISLWKKMEKGGAVFLPSASLYNVVHEYEGDYWSASCYHEEDEVESFVLTQCAKGVWFYDNLEGAFHAMYSTRRSRSSVRLVRDAE